MNADPVTHSKLDMMPIEHSHQAFFEVVIVAECCSFTEDRLSIFCADPQLGWKMWYSSLGRNSS